jgi:anionic cell wall polymer biosynthesis LytR-Cps2A-Psr (LCP) family protein
MALKYARSRHSTSDFDRSQRQQLILKGIKEKALSIGFLTSPEKIQELFTAITSHIDTSLTLGDISELAL